MTNHGKIIRATKRLALKKNISTKGNLKYVHGEKALFTRSAMDETPKTLCPATPLTGVDACVLYCDEC
jgi:hypothetical protein